MKVSDYIVEFLIAKGITDVFGYPGGMVTHLMESFRTHSNLIHAHVTYHEQAAAFAACGYAQVSGKPGVAYATSGPGATNLITGICDAYFDSIPCIFITGQVNTNESKAGYNVRQRGFQETEIVSMVSPVTKMHEYVSDPNEVPMILEQAYHTCLSGRPGPVLLDIPMNVLRSDIDNEMEKSSNYIENDQESVTEIDNIFYKYLQVSKRPIFLLGNGINEDMSRDLARTVVRKLGIPAVSSMLAVDIMANDSNYLGFCGAYGHRSANFALAKADLVISIGSRLDIRQIGINRDNFASNAQILRCDIDSGEMTYPVHKDEHHIHCSCKNALNAILAIADKIPDYSAWREVCRTIKDKLEHVDDSLPTDFIRSMSRLVPNNTVITTDVGQNQVWVAQSFLIKPGQRILFSGGHGAMGYSLPAAIGAYYASKKPVLCVAGDGGIQMNIQEFQYLAREHIPVVMIIMNNNALGMIRHFQEMYFDNHYFQTKPEGGYSAPDFCRVADAYGIPSKKVRSVTELSEEDFMEINRPKLLEVILPGNTYVTPKLRFGNPNQDQEPLLDRKLYQQLMDL